MQKLKVLTITRTGFNAAIQCYTFVVYCTRGGVTLA